jgi:hypothetical protein
MTRRQLLTDDDAVPATCQHERPCSDCPWARASLAGWLGGNTVEEWLGFARGEGAIPCHVLDGAECAGAAIFRANISKLPRNRAVLRLPADPQAVFANPMEFLAHHDLDACTGCEPGAKCAPAERADQRKRRHAGRRKR